MSKGILGRKVGMTQIFDPAGQVVPVTVIQAGPCHVLQVRTLERDKYEAVQLGFLDKPRRRAIRSERGHVAALGSKRAKKLAATGRQPVAKANCEPKRFVREFRGPTAGFEIGQAIDVSCLADVKAVDVTGTSIGRGFTGVMVRHNFKGQRATHGVKKCHRHGGSFGWSQFPSRNFKGRRAAGQHGNAQRTMRNLRVVKVDAEQHLLLLRGAVPGPIGGYLVIRETSHVKPNQPPKPRAEKKKKK
jgi:large subunit ribosomal protein L3